MAVEHFDVLIIGAGISGIGAGRYLKTELPGKTFAILEARGASGGTWDLFRYPGTRSDSDLHTFGYAFKPWRDKEAIASAPRILSYLRETATENGLDPHIRYHHRVRAAAFDSSTALWTVAVDHVGSPLTLTANWVFCAGGYYRYEQGFTPEFPGRDRFQGTIVHPQHWPAELDHQGKRVVVVGSGATAVTIVPAMAETAAHVTMLQRTPTYILSMPTKDAIGNALKKYLGPVRGHALTRRKNIAMQRAIWKFCQRRPERARRVIRWLNARQLPEGYPVDEHFRPPYNPWDQRLCLVPDGDLFKAIRAGTASVVTDRIETFTEDGILLGSGAELKADIIVTATGLQVQALGGVPLTVDGSPVNVADTIAYKGMMLSGVPNFAFIVGYTNSSWTLKVGLLCAHFCLLLAHMDKHGYELCRPEPADPDMPTRPFLDFGAGYIRRVIDQLPRQGDRLPWLTSMHYHTDVKILRADHVVDPELHFGHVATDRVAEVSGHVGDQQMPAR
ncbi:Predicted flavoprotein CzcO associated with the cation diffusion facilitator CzcD [Asanoa hainanensis]|uniref:Predicted flavoprotein CzcO associated with the cation diffusion facilitator CzcD n=1 Tax=Asanoa hainanensis TaxID=560556 RepID=A0A239LMS6_9ACTN|nr:NAD(P)/FAD-dependent oxidoreductase [Asanoa hainanensis]SNT31685.1 Predicted flavoprotein CzcO associated with the cation diffusion facilitator CzcD [Asanoa hainanensis]